MISPLVLQSEARKTTHHAIEHSRQDKANCDECDWSIGWNLDPNMIEKYFRKHQIESGHTIQYSVQYINHQTSEYVISA